MIGDFTCALRFSSGLFKIECPSDSRPKGSWAEQGRAGDTLNDKIKGRIGMEVCKARSQNGDTAKGSMGNLYQIGTLQKAPWETSTRCRSKNSYFKVLSKIFQKSEENLKFQNVNLEYALCLNKYNSTK